MRDYGENYVNDTNITTAPWEASATNIIIGDGITSIGSYAFYGCTSLMGITIPNNVTMRTQNCVNHLIAFTSSDETVATVDENGLVAPLQAGAVTITATAASGVSASRTVTVKDMVYITLPADLKIIEEEAFAGATFEAVIIPDGCTSIGSRAFADCPNLVYVRIPASVTSIAEDAFEGCEQVVVD